MGICGDDCENCVYIGEGDFYCILKQEIVMEDFAPTDKFSCCNYQSKGGDKIARSNKRPRGRPRKNDDLF